MSKLNMWKEEWNEAEWDQRARAAALVTPIKTLTILPQMPGMTEETAKNLKWKSFKWIINKDENWRLLRHFFKHPFKYSWNYLKSILKTKAFGREGDFFLYGVASIAQFKKQLQDPKALFVLGFSYCHKPFECPSGRFTDACIHDVENPVCQQCFIGKAVHASKGTDAIPLFIPTIHYIGEQMLNIIHSNPGKKVIFIITACEMTLQMFSDLGNMVGIQGLGVRLDGRICNTMKAFELSEQGIKPGLTVVLEPAQKTLLDLIRYRQEAFR
jgi:hypothetical protein